MASTFTTNKSIEKPGYNDYAANPTGWSGPINTDWDIIDKGFGGVHPLTAAGSVGTVALSTSNIQNLVLVVSGVMTGNAVFTLPLNSGATSIVAGQWIVRNSTTGAFTVTISPISGGGTSVLIPQGETITIYSDGTNVSPNRTIRDFPVGGIVMWSGTIATIPAGWFLCNGANSTPDLRDRFIIGARQDDAGVAKTNVTGSLTQTGGTKDAIVVSHTHTATVTDPGHTHSYTALNTTGVHPSGTATTEARGQVTSNTSGSNTTGITVANSTEGSSGTNANLVPYYALAYIMRGPY
jgi:hypothetical protein